MSEPTNGKQPRGEAEIFAAMQRTLKQFQDDRDLFFSSGLWSHADHPLVSPSRQSPESPDMFIVRDTGAISDADYAELMDAMNDLVKAAGGDGLKRIFSTTVGIDMPGSDTP